MVTPFPAERSPVYLSAILRSVSDGVFAVNEQGVCTFINDAGAGMLGYTPDQLVGKNMHETVHYARRDGTPFPAHECPFLRAYRSGRSAESPAETLCAAMASR